MTHPQTVVLGGKLGIRDGAALLAQLQAAMVGSSPLTIDCSGLEAADVTTLQLLIAARHTARAANRPLSLTTPPGGALDTLLRRVGILDHDGRPRAPHDAFWVGTQHSEPA